MTIGDGFRGRVTQFSAASGLGSVTTQAGETFTFHCVEIADGSREIDVGDDVTFDVIAKLGRWEAARLRP